MKCPNCQAENRSDHKFCVKCGAPLNQETRESRKPGSRKKWIVIGICLLLGLAAAGGILRSLKQPDPESGHKDEIAAMGLKKEDSDYRVLADSALYKEDGTELPALRLKKGKTVRISEISKPDDQDRVWGMIDGNYAVVREGSKDLLEKIVLENTGKWSKDSDYKSIQNVTLYSSPSVLDEEDTGLKKGNTVSLINFMEDQFGTIWAKIDSGKDQWVIVEENGEKSFEPVKKTAASESNRVPSSEIESSRSDTSADEVYTPPVQYEYLETDPQGNVYSESDYIIPESSSVCLSASDISGLSLQELNYARNEIYARHGRTFASSELQNYFNSKGWYSGTISPNAFSESMLSDIEIKNIELLKNREYALDPNGYPLS